MADDDELDGPFDIDDFDDPAAAALARLDLGSVLIPMPEAGQVQVELTERGVPSAVWVVTPNGRFTIAAYAAPKTAGLWREVAIGAGRLAAQGRPQGQHRGRPVGPRGRRRRGDRTSAGVVRFIGVDGYRWMIRCVVNGPQETIDGAGRRGARSVGGHRRSSRRHAAAGPHPAAGAVARADGRAAACGRRTGRPAAGSTGRSSSSRRRRSLPLAAASMGRRCSSCAPSPAASAAQSPAAHVAAEPLAERLVSVLKPGEAEQLTDLLTRFTPHAEV